MVEAGYIDFMDRNPEAQALHEAHMTNIRRQYQRDGLDHAINYARSQAAEPLESLYGVGPESLHLPEARRAIDKLIGRLDELQLERAKADYEWKKEQRRAREIESAAFEAHTTRYREIGVEEEEIENRLMDYRLGRM